MIFLKNHDKLPPRIAPLQLSNDWCICLCALSKIWQI